ncbi:hypothetical protein SESBI_38096 [Sesbania bispinosa]|nr:hypothetical protein SESBI_38096 [Sesbania bispinosa]
MVIPEAVDSILGKILAFKIKDAVTNQKEKSICSSLKEFELHESQSLSVMGDFDPTKIDCLTPSKRLAADEFAAQEINECQFSTTKFIKHIKTE